MKIVCVDLFCGAGGASTAVVEAAKELGLELELIAINHWPVAIATHRANYPWARHICARIDQVRPREVVKGDDPQADLPISVPTAANEHAAPGSHPQKPDSRKKSRRTIPRRIHLHKS